MTYVGWGQRGLGMRVILGIRPGGQVDRDSGAQVPVLVSMYLGSNVVGPLCRGATTSGAVTKREEWDG